MFCLMYSILRSLMGLKFFVFKIIFEQETHANHSKFRSYQRVYRNNSLPFPVSSNSVPIGRGKFFINSMCICKMYSLLLAIYAFMDIYVYDVKPPIILFHMSKLSNFTYIISFNAHMNSENIMKQNFIGQKSSNTSKSYGWT